MARQEARVQRPVARLSTPTLLTRAFPQHQPTTTSCPHLQRGGEHGNAEDLQLPSLTPKFPTEQPTKPTSPTCSVAVSTALEKTSSWRTATDGTPNLACTISPCIVWQTKHGEEEGWLVHAGPGWASSRLS